MGSAASWWGLLIRNIRRFYGYEILFRLIAGNIILRWNAPSKSTDIFISHNYPRGWLWIPRVSNMLPVFNSFSQSHEHFAPIVDVDFFVTGVLEVCSVQIFSEFHVFPRNNFYNNPLRNGSVYFLFIYADADWKTDMNGQINLGLDTWPLISKNLISVSHSGNMLSRNFSLYLNNPCIFNER